MSDNNFREMAFIYVILFIFLIPTATSNELYMTPIGQPTHLQCFPNLTLGAADTFYVSHGWLELVPGTQGRVTVTGDMGVVITDTQPKDQGMYTCHLLQRGHRHQVNIRLQVYQLAYYYKRLTVEYQARECNDRVARDRVLALRHSVCGGGETCPLDMVTQCDPDTHSKHLESGFVREFAAKMSHHHTIRRRDAEASNTNEIVSDEESVDSAGVAGSENPHGNTVEKDWQPQTDISYSELVGDNTGSDPLTHRLVIVMRQKLPDHFSPVNFTTAANQEAPQQAPVAGAIMAAATTPLTPENDLYKEELKHINNNNTDTGPLTHDKSSETTVMPLYDSSSGTMEEAFQPAEHNSPLSNTDDKEHEPKAYEAGKITLAPDYVNLDNIGKSETDDNMNSPRDGPLVKRDIAIDLTTVKSQQESNEANMLGIDVTAQSTDVEVTTAAAERQHMEGADARLDTITLAHDHIMTDVEPCDIHSMGCIEQHIYSTLNNEHIPDLQVVNMTAPQSLMKLNSFSDQMDLMCQAGYIPFRLVCLPCRPGTYSPAGSKECISCPVHTYQHAYAASHCLNCPTGTHTVESGTATVGHCLRDEHHQKRRNKFALWLGIGLCLFLSLSIIACLITAAIAAKLEKGGYTKGDVESTAIVSGSKSKVTDSQGQIKAEDGVVVDPLLAIQELHLAEGRPTYVTNEWSQPIEPARSATAQRSQTMEPARHVAAQRSQTMEPATYVAAQRSQTMEPASNVTAHKSQPIEPVTDSPVIPTYYSVPINTIQFDVRRSRASVGASPSAEALLERRQM